MKQDLQVKQFLLGLKQQFMRQKIKERKKMIYQIDLKRKSHIKVNLVRIQQKEY